MNATEIYNPLRIIWVFTQQYCAIIYDELTNENAQSFYRQGWEAHENAIADLRDDTLTGWDNHAQYCIAVFGPSVQMAFIAYQMWQNRNAPRLMPVVERQPIAFLTSVENLAPIINTSWIDWKAYLLLILMQGRAA